MATQITMPKLGQTMEEGTILSWHKQEGETIGKGDPLVSIQTDKIEYELEAPSAGTVLKTFAKEGEVIPTGGPIAFIGASGEAVPKVTPPTAVKPSPAAPPEPAKTPSPPTGTEASKATLPSREGRVPISPAARKLAQELGVDYKAIRGSGPNGRIVKTDIERTAQTKSAAPPGVRGTPVPAGKTKTIPVTGIRKVIAERMAQSWAQVARVTEIIDVDMTEIVRMRETNQALWEKVYGTKISFNDLLTHYTTRTIRRFPAVNARLEGDVIQILGDIHIGVAVQTEAGLIVPVIRNADQKDLGTIARETRDLARRGREGKLALEDVEGSTFTTTNLGAYGIQMFTPIVNLPDACILGIGKITKTPVAMDGHIAIRDILYLSLSFDHRIIDGAPAADFLQQLKAALEKPGVIPA